MKDNQWKLTKELKDKFEPIIKEFIEKVESSSIEELNNLQLNLTNKGINPYQVWQLLNELGYDDEYVDHNGWELDFWIKFEQPDRRTITMSGTGITFEVLLEVQEDDILPEEETIEVQEDDILPEEETIEELNNLFKEFSDLIKYVDDILTNE